MRRTMPDQSCLVGPHRPIRAARTRSRRPLASQSTGGPRQWYIPAHPCLVRRATRTRLARRVLSHWKLGAVPVLCAPHLAKRDVATIPNYLRLPSKHPVTRTTTITRPSMTRTRRKKAKGGETILLAHADLPACTASAHLWQWTLLARGKYRATRPKHLQSLSPFRAGGKCLISPPYHPQRPPPRPCRTSTSHRKTPSLPATPILPSMRIITLPIGPSGRDTTRTRSSRKVSPSRPPCRCTTRALHRPAMQLREACLGRLVKVGDGGRTRCTKSVRQRIVPMPRRASRASGLVSTTTMGAVSLAAQ